MAQQPVTPKTENISNTQMGTEKLRLDKWLWYARVVKSRTLAQKLISSGAVRVDSERIVSVKYLVSANMVLTMTVHDRLRILKILEIGTHRGPAVEAQKLYEDLTPELPKTRDPGTIFSPAQRAPGSGRPTKKQRRATNLLHNFSDPE